MSDNFEARLAALEQQHAGPAAPAPALVLIEGVHGFSDDELARAAAATKAGVTVILLECRDMSLRVPPCASNQASQRKM